MRHSATSAVCGPATRPQPTAAEGDLRPPGTPLESPPESPSEKLRRYARAAAPALVVYGASAAVHLVLLALMAGAGSGGPGLLDRLLAWDGRHFTDIAAYGYPDGFTYGADGKPTGNDLAFFPLFPLLSRAVHHLTGLDTGLAAVVTAHLAMIAALVVVQQLMTRLYGRRTALVVIVLLAAAQPMSIAFFMAYSESLFLALGAGALLAVHRKAWLTAGALGLLAGLTRPAAVSVAAAIAVAAALHLYRERRLSWRPPAAVALACVATPAYLWWVGNRLHRLDAWFLIQEAGWGTHWDFGRAYVDFLRSTLAGSDGWVAVSTAVLTLGLLCATVVACRRTTWPPLLVHGCVVVALTLGQSNFYHSKLRLLIPALVFLVPLARAISRTSGRTAALTLGAAALFGCWYGAYMLTVWRYAI
ncbi:hypothetical protein [Streptomyces sp. WAC06614]|uniref:hypothetical protein n=1 Tax=Streptomyces sp. WAC06614 TaxID=2487416 RepID=UPI0021AE8999|nr:hypothetical protein [Streptomyces sp. WAC06614]